MPRTEARIHVKVWANRDFTSLPQHVQWTYFAILTQPDIALTGVLTYHPTKMSNLTGDADQGQLDTAIKELEEASFVEFDPVSCEVWVRTFAKYDGVLKNRNLRAGMWAAYLGIQSTKIRSAFVNQYCDLLDEALEQGWITTTDVPQEGGSLTPGKAVPDRQEGGSSTPEQPPSQTSGTSDSSPPPLHLQGDAHEDHTNGTPPSTWDKAYRRVTEQVQTYGFSGARERPRLDERTEAVLRELGGFGAVCRGDSYSMKFEFRDAWKALT